MPQTDNSPAAPRRVRMEEVAKVAGVSLATVSRALKSPDTVSEKLRTRVQEAAARLGYAPNRIAGSLAGARTPLVGVIVPSLTNSFFAATLERMTELLEDKGYQLMIGQHAYDAEREERIVAAFSSWNPSALVVTGRDHTRGTVGILSATPCPVIEMWDHDARPLDTGIGFSNREAGRLAGRHFAEQGFRSVAYVGAILDKDGRARSRAEGFREEVRRLTGRDALVVNAGSRDLGEGGAALKQVMTQQPGTRAIAFSGDMLAVGAMFEAARMGLRIPDDLALLGYGDLDIAVHSNPPLSTIRPPHDEIGAAVARHILHRLKDPAAVPENIDLGVRLIRRQTA